ncbi:MAG: alpha-galactosidase [Carboxylicivirga sp.]|jgi:hypothetical protein|nr:alpha-galactosidase [Carboxylicivirga sp.]
MHRYLLVFLLVALFGSTGIVSQTSLKKCTAKLENDTLIVSNDMIEALYLWNNGDLINYSVKDVNSGKILKFQKPDKSGFGMSGIKGVAKNGQIQISEEGGPLYKDHIAVEVVTNFDNVSLKRILRIYPGASAVITDFYLKALSEIKTSEKVADSYMNKLDFGAKNLVYKAIGFTGQTDYFNNLVEEKEVMSYSRIPMNGNILTIKKPQDKLGLFLYKKAPLREAYASHAGIDFEAHGSRIDVLGVGCDLKDLKTDQWTKAYSLGLGMAASDNELDLLKAIRQMQMAEHTYVVGRDDMVMMNTWGDRSKDGRMSERFIMNELDKCKELGVTHFQLDDGWQAGLSHNSAFKGKNKAWEKWAVEDWLPHAERFPNGLEPLVKKAKKLNIQLGLWFNPSSHNDYEAWENDADILIGLYRRYDIRIFKIDGMQINNKLGEERFLKFYNKVINETEGEVFFNLDVTAGKRFGYHFLHANHNIFLENRYTDSRSYYPFRTLRNLWMLSKYVPAQCLQIEFLNKWRNQQKYGEDELAPNQMPFGYLFATTCIAQPLAWFEVSGLPAEAYEVAPLIKQYNKIRSDLHKGCILPVGEMPDGYSWTGFQSIIDDKTGYLMIYREKTGSIKGRLKTWLKPGQTVLLTKVFGEGAEEKKLSIKDGGFIDVELPGDNTFVLYTYKVL